MSPRLELLAVVGLGSAALYLLAWVDVLGAAWAAGALP